MGKLGTLFKYVPKAGDVLLHREKYKNLLNETLSVVKKHATLEKIKDDVFLLLSLVKDTATLRYKSLGKRNLLLITAALLYLINPMDFIPDFIVGLGFTDDIGMITFVLAKMEQELRKYKEWKTQQPSSRPKTGEQVDWEKSAQENMTDPPRYTVEKMDPEEVRAWEEDAE